MACSSPQVSGGVRLLVNPVAPKAAEKILSEMEAKECRKIAPESELSFVLCLTVETNQESITYSNNIILPDLSIAVTIDSKTSVFQ